MSLFTFPGRRWKVDNRSARSTVPTVGKSRERMIVALRQLGGALLRRAGARVGQGVSLDPLPTSQRRARLQPVLKCRWSPPARCRLPSRSASAARPGQLPGDASRLKPWVSPIYRTRKDRVRGRRPPITERHVWYISPRARIVLLPLRDGTCCADAAPVSLGASTRRWRWRSSRSCRPEARACCPAHAPSSTFREATSPYRRPCPRRSKRLMDFLRRSRALPLEVATDAAAFGSGRGRRAVVREKAACEPPSIRSLAFLGRGARECHRHHSRASCAARAEGSN